MFSEFNSTLLTCNTPTSTPKLPITCIGYVTLAHAPALSSTTLSCLVSTTDCHGTPYLRLDLKVEEFGPLDPVDSLTTQAYSTAEASRRVAAKRAAATRNSCTLHIEQAHSDIAVVVVEHTGPPYCHSVPQ